MGSKYNLDEQFAQATTRTVQEKVSVADLIFNTYTFHHNEKQHWNSTNAIQITLQTDVAYESPRVNATEHANLTGFHTLHIAR